MRRNPNLATRSNVSIFQGNSISGFLIKKKEKRKGKKELTKSNLNKKINYPMQFKNEDKCPWQSSVPIAKFALPPDYMCDRVR